MSLNMFYIGGLEFGAQSMVVGFFSRRSSFCEVRFEEYR
jgi:hypothetical protein